MFVFGEGTPHAAVDAVAEAGDVGGWGAGGRGVEGCEDEFGGGEFGDVGFEG